MGCHQEIGSQGVLQAGGQVRNSEPWEVMGQLALGRSRMEKALGGFWSAPNFIPGNRLDSRVDFVSQPLLPD